MHIYHLFMKLQQMDLANKINEMDDESFNEYFKYHLYLCEKPELLGMTIHNLFICRK